MRVTASPHVGYVVLSAAIAAEVGATVALRMSQGFSRPWLAVASLCGYALALAGLAFASRSVPLSVSYATWAGLGTLGALVAARTLFGERLNTGQLAGAALVVAGVAMMHALATKAAE